jgi:hypothetical protein
LSPEVLTYEVETLSDIVTYNKTDNSWLVADSWDFIETLTIEAQLNYRTKTNPNSLLKQSFSVIVSPKMAELASSEKNLLADTADHTPIEFSLERIDNRGFANLMVNRPLSRTWDWNETFIHYALDLSIKLAPMQTHLDFTWKYVNFEQQKLTLWLNFTKPLLVSASGDFDFLVVHTNATILNTLFVDSSGGRFLSN